MEAASKISPRTSSAQDIDDWTRRLRDICGTFGLTAVIENEMPSVDDVRDAMVGASEQEVLEATRAAQQKWLLLNAEYYHVLMGSIDLTGPWLRIDARMIDRAFIGDGWWRDGRGLFQWATSWRDAA